MHCLINFHDNHIKLKDIISIIRRPGSHFPILCAKHSIACVLEKKVTYLRTRVLADLHIPVGSTLEFYKTIPWTRVKFSLAACFCINTLVDNR